MFSPVDLLYMGVLVGIGLQVGKNIVDIAIHAAEVTYIRLNNDLDDWIINLVQKTGLDKSKIIRLILEQAKKDGVTIVDKTSLD